MNSELVSTVLISELEPNWFYSKYSALSLTLTGKINLFLFLAKITLSRYFNSLILPFSTKLDKNLS